MNKPNAEIHIHKHTCMKKKIQFDFEPMCAVCELFFFYFFSFLFFLLFSHSVWIWYGLLFYSIKCLVCCLNLSIVKWRQDKKKQPYTAHFCIHNQSTRFSKASESINSIKDRKKEIRRGWREIDRESGKKRTCAIATTQ